RSHRQSLCERHYRNRLGVVHRHAAGEHDRARPGVGEYARNAGEGAGMSNGSLRVQRISPKRRLVNGLVTYSALGASILVIVPLVAIFAYLLMKGIGSINWAFLTQLPKPVGEKGGGMGNAIVGSGIILIIASAFGIPLGIGAGIFLAEFGRNTLGNVVRFTSDVLNGVPSIVVGIAVYGLVVVTQK